MDDRDVDAFFDRLGGRAPAAEAPPGLLQAADELRAEFLRRSADPARASELSEDERADRDALFARLAASGAFAATPGALPARSTERTSAGSAAAPAPATYPGAPTGTGEPGHGQRRPSLADSLRSWFKGPWQRPLAFASILVLGSVVALKILLEPPAEESVVRGGHDPVLQVDHPAVLAEQLRQQLTSDGAMVVLAELGGNRWALSIAMPGDAVRRAVEMRLQALGVTVPAETEWILQIAPR